MPVLGEAKREAVRMKTSFEVSEQALVRDCLFAFQAIDARLVRQLARQVRARVPPPDRQL